MLRRSMKKERGASAVEFALLLPVFLAILFGVIEFGLALWRKQMLTNAVREGARVGIVAAATPKNAGEIEAVVAKFLADAGWDTSKLDVNVTNAGAAKGTPLTVEASYPSSFLVLSQLEYGGVTDGTIMLEASVTMQME